MAKDAAALSPGTKQYTAGVAFYKPTCRDAEIYRQSFQIKSESGCSIALP